MPSINMIAARRAEKKFLEKLVRIALLVIVGELAVAIGVLGFMTARVHSARWSISQLDRKLSKIQPTVDRIRSYESEIKKLEPRLNLLADSREQTLLWHTILLNLSRSMPESTWLNSLTTNQAAAAPPSSDAGAPAPAPIVTLAGVSVSQGLVGETMLRLNQFPEFDRVDLSYTQPGGDERSPAVQFQIAAKLKSSEPEKGGASNNVSN